MGRTESLGVVSSVLHEGRSLLKGYRPAEVVMFGNAERVVPTERRISVVVHQVVQHGLVEIVQHHVYRIRRTLRCFLFRRQLPPLYRAVMSLQSILYQAEAERLADDVHKIGCRTGAVMGNAFRRQLLPRHIGECRLETGEVVQSGLPKRLRVFVDGIG